MVKKRSSMLRRLMTVALIVMLCVSMAVPAFAAGNPITGTESDPAEAAITKVLQMPTGTTTPNATFEFVFTKQSVDGSTAPGDLATMPTLSNQSVTFVAADLGTDSAGVKSVPKETGHLFGAVSWPHAGVYIYTVTEAAGTYTISNPAAEQMTYATTSYDIAVYVETGSSGLYVSAIAATIQVVDNPGQTQGDKVDPTPGDKTVTVGDYSQMIFTNAYLKNNGGAGLGDQVLAISKEVTGAFGDRTKYFSYDVTITKPAVGVTGTPAYKAYVVERTGTVDTVVTTAANGTIAGSDGLGAYIECTSGALQTVNLKHGQRLAFLDMPVGTTFTAMEQAAVDYTPGYVLTLNGVAGAVQTGTVNTAFGISTNQYVGENANAAAFTNLYKTVTPTGISVDNLPYIALIAVALIALLGFVVVKIRSRRHV